MLLFFFLIKITFKLSMRGLKQKKFVNNLEVVQRMLSKEKKSDYRVKFEISMDNIACFMKGRRFCNDKSRNRSIAKKKSKQKKNVINKVLKQDPGCQRKSASPDIVREYSNTILSQIQEKGLKCQWIEGESKTNLTHNVDQQYQSLALNNIFSLSHEKSHASTIAPHSNCINHEFQPIQNYSFAPNYFSSTNYSYTIDQKSITDYRTTLMIRNIPNKYTIQQLAEQIDSEHAGTYDFLYLPCDPKNLCNVGYGFINFIGVQHLDGFYEKFSGYIWKKYRSQKICALTYARLQGLIQLIEHFQNSKVFNQKDRRFKPIIKYNNQNNNYNEIHKIVKQQQQK